MRSSDETRIRWLLPQRSLCRWNVGLFCRRVFARNESSALSLELPSVGEDGFANMEIQRVRILSRHHPGHSASGREGGE